MEFSLSCGFGELCANVSFFFIGVVWITHRT